METDRQIMKMRPKDLKKRLMVKFRGENASERRNNSFEVPNVKRSMEYEVQRFR